MSQEVLKAKPIEDKKQEPKSKGNIWLIIAVLALIYVISPIDALPGIILDDIPVGGLSITSILIYILKNLIKKKAQ